MRPVVPLGVAPCAIVAVGHWRVVIGVVKGSSCEARLSSFAFTGVDWRTSALHHATARQEADQSTALERSAAALHHYHLLSFPPTSDLRPHCYIATP